MSKDNFTSKLGIVAATAGSAIGLGNLWGFPYKAGTNGGGTFVIIYILCALFIGLPVMLAEFVVGREGRGGPVGAVENLTNSKKSPFVLGGYMAVLTSFLVLSFYSVIAGWAIHYLVTGLTNGFSGVANIDTAKYFEVSSNNLGMQLVYQDIFIFLTATIVIFGIKNGIERLSKIMMPLLFIIILILVGYNMTLPGFKDSLSFLFAPKSIPADKTFFEILTSALGQAFFSLSLGMGAIITYARAVSDDMNINTISIQVIVCDLIVALLAGLATFPIIFSYGMSTGGGVGLAFIALPVGFKSMPFGYVFGNLFFFLLIIAALTSSISLLENSLTFIIEKMKFNRKMATIVLSALLMAFATLSQLGFNYSSSLLSFTGGETFLDQLDKLTMNYFIPIVALITTLLVGYRLDESIVRKQINNDKISNIFIPYVKYVVPVLIGIVLLSGVIG